MSVRSTHSPVFGILLAGSLAAAGCSGMATPGGGGDDDGADGGIHPPVDGLGEWTGHDNVAWSQDPPFGLHPDEVPQLVSIGFDDNGYSGLDGSAGTGGFTWSTDLAKRKTNPDGSPVKFSYYLTTYYISTWGSESPTYVKRAWHQALLDGHDIGDHTETHSHGAAFSAEQWATEIQTCIDWVTKPFDPAEVNFSPDNAKGAGIPADIMYGYRTPFLEYNDATFGVLLDKGFYYDTSVEEGWQEDIDGSNMPWPFTLDNGSPGNELLVSWQLDPPKEHMTSHPGLWELSPHPFIVPPDDKCADYGLDYSLRNKLHDVATWFDLASGKITGLDYNLWVQFKVTKAEFLAIMKYTLDQRLAGNRAPFTIGAHTDIYSSKYMAAPNATAEERQQAIEELIDYALSKPAVRILSNKQILDWVRNPVPL
jgi:peptidoglycan/xylan/chitin deacetylase (PgdA/CDA1 family)